MPARVEALNFQQKLGHLYEDALAQLLAGSPQYQVLAQNLQIQKDAQHTLGELDFLFRDLPSGHLIHLELATKFYLAIETPEGLTLPGPDARDNYFKKIARLRDHQLKIPALFKEYLPTQYQREPILSQHLVNGCIFDHIASSRPATPPFLSRFCRRGKWLSQDEIPQYFAPETRLQIIPKALWPVPLDLLDSFSEHLESPLENWHPNTPRTPLSRGLMLRMNESTTPHFIVNSSHAQARGE